MPLRIALVPLDERPVNTGLVRDVAAIAGAELVLPPHGLLPSYRAPGDAEGIGAWLRAEAPSLDAAVVSIDTLVHGGLIPSRTSTDTAAQGLARLETLRDLHRRHPSLKLAAVSVVMRASDSYSAVEEPEYWSHAGREVHALGGAVHLAWSGSGDVPEPPLADDIRSDHARRRLRNHVVGLAALGLAWDGVLDPLIITADDTATWSSGSAEQRILDYWQRLRGGPGVLIYPGADETGAVLLARVLLAGTGESPRVLVLPGDPEGLELVPAYENVPLRESIARQLAAVGAVEAQTTADADLVVVVHTPDPGRADHFGGDPVPDLDAVAATLRALDVAAASGLPVALADLRYGNGADIALVDALSAVGALDRLEAFAGWNTAGNALGSLLALAVAATAGRRRGTLDDAARRRALRRRLADDAAYQARVRRSVARDIFGGRIEPAGEATVARAEAAITAALARELETLAPGEAIARVTLPWRRSFEIDVVFAGEER